jgi:hypothetical protein
MKKFVFHLLYHIAKSILYGFEAIMLVKIFILCYILHDLQIAIYGVILGILILPILWYFLEPKRQAELKFLKDFYEKNK